MQTHGFDPTEEDLKDMIRNVDTNANGAIDFNEFIEMMVKGRGHSVEDDVVHAFKVFDRDGNKSGIYDPGGVGWLEISANLEWLVLGCIEAKFCK